MDQTELAMRLGYAKLFGRLYLILLKQPHPTSILASNFTMDHFTIKNQPNDFPQQYLFTGLFTQLSSSPSGKILVLPDSQSPLVCTDNHICVYYEHWYLNKYNCNPALEVLERQVHKIQCLMT